MRSTFVLACILLGVGSGAAERVGRLSDPAIRETSGIVKSRRHADVFWVHGDSGNPPALFAVRRDGTLVRAFRVAAPNVDWEDIATDDDGHLYVGDIGNNGGRLPIRAIYRVDEPDPDRPADAPLAVTLATHYRFARDGRFDAESLVIDGKRAIVIAKTFDGREAELLAVPLDPPAPLLRPVVPVALGSLSEFREPATGADLTPDGRLLAVCSTNVARVYERDGTTWRLVGRATYEAGDVEAICWDGLDLILGAEGGELSRIAEARWRLAPGEARRAP